MTDILIPPWLNIARVNYSPVTNVGVSQPPYGGITRTAAYDRGRMRASMEFTAVGGSSTQLERGTLEATLSRAGRADRVVFGNPAFRIRGSFPTSELLTNNTFASGVTGWTQLSPVFTVADRVARITRIGFTTSVDTLSQATAITGLTQYAPYVCRSFDVIGRGTWTPGVQLGSVFATNDYGLSTASGGGMKTLMVVVPATSAHFGLVDFQSTDNQAGDYYEVPYTSMARCALVDAGVNLLLRSDEFDNATWTKANATVGANAIAAPDGTTTADSLIDNATSATHRFIQAVTVTSAAQDMQCTFAVKAGSRNFCKIDLTTGTGNAAAFINLTTGAVSNVSASTSFSNARAFAASFGDGWWRFSLVARKISSETSVNVQVNSSDSSTTATYSGASDAALYVWRGTASLSGVPARLVQTTTAATSGETQRANGLHLKGLPDSTNGLLLKGDAVEVVTASRGGEYKIVTAALNSDASGLGYLQVAPAVRISPSDNAAVIIQFPMGRFISLSDAESWNTDPGIITTASAEFIEA